MYSQEARIYFAVISAVVLFAVVLIYFAVSIIRQQRRNLQLQKANMFAEINAMEKERARIAADLHDDIGPVLSAVKFQVDNVDVVQEDEKEQLQKASRYLDELIGRMREVANNLMPSAIKRKGVIVAIEEFIGKVGERDNLEIKFRHPGTLTLSEVKSINIYRMMQEVIHNCLKHSRASVLLINFEEDNDNLRITCRDNGIGFDYPKRLKEGQGMGLHSLRNRTEIVKGTFKVDSKIGRGTTFLFEIPVNS